jgi:sigma-B regulation protein RsbU (phosphoserine phosphatase)
MSGPGRADGKLLSLRIPARAERLREVREAVERAVLAGGGSRECAQDVVIAVDEACQNVIRHAYCGECDEDIELEMERRGDDLLLHLRDFAPAIDPSRVKPRELDDVRPGGLGVHFIRSVMDEASFAPGPEGRGNVLRMRKRIG